MVIKCPNCGSEKVDKKVLDIHEKNYVKYLEVKLRCEICGHTDIREVARRPVKKIEEEPEIDIEPLVTVAETSVNIPYEEKKATISKLSMVFSNIKKTLFYLSALLLGILVEVFGIFLEQQMMILGLPAFIGFSISLIFFIVAPPLVVGAYFYFFKKDILKGLFLGALAVPLSMILIPYMRRFQWNYLELIKEIYGVLLA
jgi:hypothetical protein